MAAPDGIQVAWTHEEIGQTDRNVTVETVTRTLAGFRKTSTLQGFIARPR